MGYSPSMWGREAWHFIHYVTLNYPNNPTDQDKKLYQQFFEALPKVLPCPICGLHFLENLHQNEIRLDSKKDLFEWGVDMHNAVNESNGRKVLTYEEALQQINKNSSKGRYDSEIMNHNKVQYLLNQKKRLK
jgi:hypothetical protein